MKRNHCLWIEDNLWKQMIKSGSNISQETSNYWRMKLEIPDKKSDLLKAKEEHLQEIIAIDIQLQQHKTKAGISFIDFLKTIEENENYTPELIETIKFELIESLRIIKENPQTKIARINILNNKFALKLDLPIVENFLVETDSKESEYYIEKSKSMPRSTYMNGAMVHRKKIVENL